MSWFRCVSRRLIFRGSSSCPRPARFLWRLLENGADREELIAKLLDEYLVDDEAAAAAMSTALSRGSTRPISLSERISNAEFLAVMQEAFERGQQIGSRRPAPVCCRCSTAKTIR